MSKCTIPSFAGQVIFCGFDVHKDTWSVCVRHCGREIAAFPAPADARAIAGKLRRDYPDAEIRSVYEAGFSGFEAHRILVEEHGLRNIVINPADVPTSNKERKRKSDRTDCRKPAKALEAGLLEPIYVPSRDHLRFRNLVRRDTQTTRSLTRTVNQLKSHWHFNGIAVPPESLHEDAGLLPGAGAQGHGPRRGQPDRPVLLPHGAAQEAPGVGA